MNEFNDWYREDLAHIHDVGFSDYALKSASSIVEILHEDRIQSGLIVDLGCGSGLSAREFIKANYRVLGIDISSSMIEIARQKVPEATFKIASFLAVEIPSCVVVTSIGECLNYLFDIENTLDNLTHLFTRIYKALIPGGIFIFDLLIPHTTAKTQGFKEGKDWIVLYEKKEDREQKKLTRRIITLRKKNNCYHKDEEIHQVRLYEAAEISERLQKVGFQVKTQNNYGQFYLNRGHKVFIARKNSDRE